MGKTTQAKSAAPYVRRLVEDKYVREQLRSAAAGLETAYLRVRRQGGQAAEDKRLYGGVRQAATSLRNAIVAVQRPKPQPERRLEKLAAATLAAASALLVVKRQTARPRPQPGSDTASPGVDAA